MQDIQINFREYRASRSSKAAYFLCKKHHIRFFTFASVRVTLYCVSSLFDCQYKLWKIFTEIYIVVLCLYDIGS